MLEEFSSETPLFRLTFSSIKCHIKLQDFSILALAVKVGKNYSQPTSKIQLKNGLLQFPNCLSIPINEDLVYNNNPRKQKVITKLTKCQVMLYRYFPEQKDKPTQAKDLADSNTTKKQKEKKNLIGMASLIISGELFSEKVKTFRITNTFDKDATITCNIKICHDIFQCNEEGISSIGQRSNASSIHKGDNLSENKPLNGISQMIRAQKQLNSKYKKKKIPELNLSRMSEQNQPVSTKEMGSYSERHLVENYEQRELTKTERMYGPKQQIFSGRIKRNDRNIQSFSQKYERKDSNQGQESQDIFQFCNNLQQQNNLLMNKIQNLQNHILNKSPSSETAQLEQATFNKSQSLVKASMIKKNNTFTTSVSTTVTKLSDVKSSSSTKEKTQSKQQNEGESPKILPNESNFSFKPPAKMISIKEMDVQHQSSKIITPRSQLAQKISFGFDQNSQVSHFQNIEVRQSRLKPMTIESVITVAYVPPIQPIVREFSETSRSRIDRMEKSISQNERSFSKSYSKFNSVKRHHIENVNKKVSLLSEVQKKDFGLQTETEKLPDIPKLKITQSDLDQPILVTINGLQNHVNGSIHKSENQVKITNRTTDVSASRSNLQDVNQLIEQKYRKTEKYLKMANQQLLLQNKSLKKQKKILQDKIGQKNHLSQDQFTRLQSNSGNHEMQIKYYFKLVSEKDEQIDSLRKKLHQAHQQNQSLQRNMRQQKKTVSYFIKTSHFHDQRQKELQMKLKLIEQHYNIQDTIVRSDTNYSKSHIVMPSPKVIYRSAKKQSDNQAHLIIKKDQKGYATQRMSNSNATMAHYAPQIRFSVTKMTEAQQQNHSSITPFSKAQILTDKQKSVQSKGLLSLKKHSVPNTKRTHDQARQLSKFQNSIDNIHQKTNPKEKLNSFQNFTERKNLSIKTKF